MKRKLSLFLVCALLMSMLAACGNSGENGNASGETTETPKVVSIVRSDLPSHVDPVYGGSADCGEIISMITSGLYYVDGDNTVQLDVATNAVESEDHLKITYTIGDSTYYDCNGQAVGKVTAHDFEFAWKRLIDLTETENNQNTLLATAGVKNAQAICDGEMKPADLGVYAQDDSTFVVEFDHYVPYREQVLAHSSMAPVLQSYREEKGAEFGTSADTMLYNGPYLLTDFAVGGTSLTLHRNSNFSGYSAGVGNVDEVNFVKIQDSQQAVLAYDNGDVDVLLLTGEQADVHKDDEGFVQVGQAGISYLAVNCVAYDNQNLRNALLHALDKEALCADVLKDGSVAANFIVPEGLALDADGNDFRVSGGVYAEYDVAKAQEFWKAAQEEMGVSELSMDFLITSDEAAYTVGAWIQDQIQTNLPGVTVNLVTVPYENKMDKVMAGDFGFSIVTWGADYADALAFLSCYVTGFPINVSKWSDPEYDEIIASCTNGELSTDMAARANALQKAEGMFFEGASVIPLYQSTRSLLVRPTISGINYHLTGNTYDYRNMRVD